MEKCEGGVKIPSKLKPANERLCSREALRTLAEKSSSLHCELPSSQAHTQTSGGSGQFSIHSQKKENSGCLVCEVNNPQSPLVASEGDGEKRTHRDRNMHPSAHTYACAHSLTRKRLPSLGEDFHLGVNGVNSAAAPSPLPSAVGTENLPMGFSSLPTAAGAALFLGENRS